MWLIAGILVFALLMMVATLAYFRWHPIHRIFELELEKINRLGDYYFGVNYSAIKNLGFREKLCR